MSDGITSLPWTELVQLGARIRTPYLLEQASVTIPQARAVGEALAKLMRPGLIDNVERIRSHFIWSCTSKLSMSSYSFKNKKYE